MGIRIALILVLGLAVCCFAQAVGVRDAESEKQVFESYFPDSNEAGSKLDEWWKANRTQRRPSAELLEMIRNGLRNSRYNRAEFVGFVGGAFLMPTDPDLREKAVDLLYHASFSPEGYVRHYAVFFGLSGIREKSGRVIERLATLAMSNESVNRIVWGVTYSKQVDEFLTHLEIYGSSPHGEVRRQAEMLAELVDEQVKQLARQEQARRQQMQELQQQQEEELVADPNVSYEEAFGELYETLANAYPCFELKGIDWEAVGEELLPRVKDVNSEADFCLLCTELVARLEDSHAYLMDGAAKIPDFNLAPEWDAGFACLEDDKGRPAVYHVDPDGPADRTGVKVGMVVLRIDGEDVDAIMKRTMARMKKYGGYSSERYLRYHAHKNFIRQFKKGSVAKYEMLDTAAKAHSFELPAELGPRYSPRLPVPNPGIRDSGFVSWKMLEDNIGYIYIRRVREGLEAALDRAVGDLKGASGLIVDIRGNSGGGFNGPTSHVNFYTADDTAGPNRPRFEGPIALLIDSRCISAGEGWGSWFIARKRAKLFGEATAGASSAKKVYTLKNRLYKVNLPVRPRRGFLDRPIERRGLEPDVEVKQNTTDLAQGRDTALEAARRYLLEAGAGKENDN